MSQNANIYSSLLLRGLKINLSSETKKAILLNLRYHRDKKYQLFEGQLCANSGEKASEQVQRIRADSFISEIEQQEIERALMTQARFHSEKRRNLKRGGFRSRIEISDNYIGLAPARRCKNSGNARCCHDARALLDEQP